MKIVDGGSGSKRQPIQKKEPVDLLIGGEGREDIETARLGCLEPERIKRMCSAKH